MPLWNVEYQDTDGRRCFRQVSAPDAATAWLHVFRGHADAWRPRAVWVEREHKEEVKT